MPTPKKTPGMSFNNTDVFGKGFVYALSMSYCVVGKLINDNVLNMDGTIDRRDIVAWQNTSKRTIWLYIYYLWQHNRDLPIFIKMSQVVGGIQKASARLFVDTIVQYLMSKQYVVIAQEGILSKDNLADFIELCLSDSNNNAGAIRIPFLENMFRRISEKQELYNDYIEDENNELQRRIDEVQSQETKDVKVEETDVYAMTPDNKILLKPKGVGQPIELRLNVQMDGGRQRRSYLKKNPL